LLIISFMWNVFMHGDGVERGLIDCDTSDTANSILTINSLQFIAFGCGHEYCRI